MMFSREATTASDTEAATPPRMASTTNRRFRRGVIYSFIRHEKRALRAHACRRVKAAGRPDIPEEHQARQTEARPDEPCVPSHGPKVHDLTASRTQADWRSRLSTSPRNRVHTTAA